MSPEHAELLFRRYPIIFGATGDVHASSCITCGDGWFDIIDRLCAIAQRARDIHRRPAEIVRIKEKWGTLRIYVRNGDENLLRSIADAATQSEVTCEMCGAAGALRTDHKRIKVLCETHASHSDIGAPITQR